ncbi:MAG: hypothetical protein Q9225_002824 [Loekoesia sp. 1 TL-2023]
MAPTPKRKRRTFSDTEKERIKHVRRHGACLECKAKKRKCTHVPYSQNNRHPQTPDSEDSELLTPEPVAMSSPINFTPEGDFEEFGDLVDYGMM